MNTYEFYISLSEGIKPSEISDLQSVISRFANNRSFEHFDVKHEFIYGFRVTDTTLHIKLNISKYIDKYYMIELIGAYDSFNIPETELYSFINSFVYKMYENKVINKYILYVEDNEYTPELWYPIGNLDLPSSLIYHKIYTINWIVYPLLIQISLRKDYEMMDTLFENMNPKYFKEIKNAYYDEIMNLSDNSGSNIGYGIINTNFFSDDDFKIRFIHWCNHYAAMNEDSEDSDITL